MLESYRNGQAAGPSRAPRSAYKPRGPNCKTAASSKSPNRWPDMSRRAPPVFTTGATTLSPSMRLRKSHIDVFEFAYCPIQLKSTTTGRISLYCKIPTMRRARINETTKPRLQSLGLDRLGCQLPQGSSLAVAASLYVRFDLHLSFCFLK